MGKLECHDSWRVEGENWKCHDNWKVKGENWDMNICENYLFYCNNCLHTATSICFVATTIQLQQCLPACLSASQVIMCLNPHSGHGLLKIDLGSRVDQGMRKHFWGALFTFMAVYFTTTIIYFIVMTVILQPLLIILLSRQLILIPQLFILVWKNFYFFTIIYFTVIGVYLLTQLFTLLQQLFIVLHTYCVAVYVTDMTIYFATTTNPVCMFLHATGNTSYTFQSAVPMSSETHGGEDVTIYANGQSWLLLSENIFTQFKV